LNDSTPQEGLRHQAGEKELERLGKGLSVQWDNESIDSLYVCDKNPEFSKSRASEAKLLPEPCQNENHMSKNLKKIRRSEREEEKLVRTHPLTPLAIISSTVI
jgi:hypothetical protein